MHLNPADPAVANWKRPVIRLTAASQWERRRIAAVETEYVQLSLYYVSLQKGLFLFFDGTHVGRASETSNNKCRQGIFRTDY